MSIAENIAFGLKIKRQNQKSYIDDKDQVRAEARKTWTVSRNRSVDSLSGGQQQRIAIARAIVKRAEASSSR